MSVRNDVYKIVEELFRNDIKLVKNALNCLERIEKNTVDSEFVDAICQKFKKVDFINIYDAHFINTIETFIKLGKIYYKVIELGDTPSGNNELEENNNKLKNLPNQFKAEFLPSSGRGAENDGYFELLEGTITFEYENGNIDEGRKEVGYLHIPLEVGTTESYITYKHIMMRGGVARWPYYSNQIHIFYNPIPLTLGETHAKDSKLIDKNLANYEVGKKMEYRGREDHEKLLVFLQWINDEVSKIGLPTNLYTHTSSLLDVAIINFTCFDLNNVPIYTDGMCVVQILNRMDDISNHLIIYPNSVMKVEISVNKTSGGDISCMYSFLAINLYV